MTGKIRAIVKRPDEKYGHVTFISPTLENLQKTVDGNIETILLRGGNVLLVNEDGKNQKLPVNFLMTRGHWGDIIVGTVAVVGTDGEEFSDCTMQFDTWKKLLDAWGN